MNERTRAIDEFAQHHISPDTFPASKFKKDILKRIHDEKDPTQQVAYARFFLSVAGQMQDDDIELLGVRILERASDRPIGESCFTYIFGDKDVKEITDWMVDGCEVSKKPEPNSQYVLYLTEEMKPTHVGRIVSEGKVISKWGVGGHVIEHKTFQVPLEYGSYCIYIAPPKTN